VACVDSLRGVQVAGPAFAAAAGLAPLARAPDRAGSGRVLAGLANIVGLKPSLGLVSTAGLVPACRTLDCASVFALTVDDAFTALELLAGPPPPPPPRGPRPPPRPRPPPPRARPRGAP